LSDPLFDLRRRSPRLKVAGQIDLGRTVTIPIDPGGISDPWWIRGVTAGEVLAVTVEGVDGAEAVGLVALVQEETAPAMLTEAGGWLGGAPLRPRWSCYLIAQEPGGRLLLGAPVPPAGLPAARVRVERRAGWKPPAPCAEFEGSWTFYAAGADEGDAAAKAAARALRQVMIRSGLEGDRAAERLARHGRRSADRLGAQVVVALTVDRAGFRPAE
jgi:hypothetical protein